MNFGKALENIKLGKAVARHGWNGRNMRVWLEPGFADFSQFNGVVPNLIGGVPANLFTAGDHGIATTFPHLCMTTPAGDVVKGWLASQTDMLADDWYVYDL